MRRTISIMFATATFCCIKSGRFWCGKSLKHPQLHRMKCSSVHADLTSTVLEDSSNLFFHVAPMMAHTDRHFRYMFRLLSSSAVLYTEMIMSDVIVNHADNKFKLDQLLEYHPTVILIFLITCSLPILLLAHLIDFYGVAIGRA